MNIPVELQTEEQKHEIRMIGFAETSRRELVKQVLHDVRMAANHRLEDIYAFADREVPVKHEIMDIVREIQELFLRIEAKHLPPTR